MSQELQLDDEAKRALEYLIAKGFTSDDYRAAGDYYAQREALRRVKAKHIADADAKVGQIAEALDVHYEAVDMALASGLKPSDPNFDAQVREINGVL